MYYLLSNMSPSYDITPWKLNIIALVVVDIVVQL